MSKATNASPQINPMFGAGPLRQWRAIRSESVVASRCHPL
jgi:hypothetical protein